MSRRVIWLSNSVWRSSNNHALWLYICPDMSSESDYNFVTTGHVTVQCTLPDGSNAGIDRCCESSGWSVGVEKRQYTPRPQLIFLTSLPSTPTKKVFPQLPQKKSSINSHKKSSLHSHKKVFPQLPQKKSSLNSNKKSSINSHKKSSLHPHKKCPLNSHKNYHKKFFP